jgi:hypothetical protein
MPFSLLVFGSEDIIRTPRCSLGVESFRLKHCFPLVGTCGHEWVHERYGQFTTSQLDESRLFAVRKVSDVFRCLSSCLVFVLIGVENAFPPSVVKSKHGWRTGMHLEGRNEVENRNGACVIEVASWAPVRR